MNVLDRSPTLRTRRDKIIPLKKGLNFHFERLWFSNEATRRNRKTETAYVLPQIWCSSVPRTLRTVPDKIVPRQTSREMGQISQRVQWSQSKSISEVGTYGKLKNWTQTFRPPRVIFTGGGVKMWENLLSDQ